MDTRIQDRSKPSAPVTLIDTHCHIDVEEFDGDRSAVLDRAYTQGVGLIVVPAIHAAAWQRLVDCCAACPERLTYALGLHPVYLDRHNMAQLRELETRLAAQRPVAIGEIGLDFFVRELDRNRQKEIFEAQLAIADAANLPVLLHVRKAHDQVLQSLKHFPRISGIVHAFNGSMQQAQQYIDRGFKLGFGGMLTYARSTKLKSLAQALPLETLVLETDAPDLAVAQHHGQRNSPEYLPYCLAALSAIRETDPHVIAAQTTANACSVLRLTRP